jgi:asparagine synthase (glutamine-hydrolysing)
MCGIAGWLGHLANREEYAVRMCEVLRHRGPDGHGIQSWPEATLIHTRLSIIDLSPTGAQPMANEDGTIWTVFNGEIYNHRELRRDLRSRGHVFKGLSDTEVLPHLYEEHGANFVTKLRGMFAFAIYDLRAHKLLLARDRFGIKPLFFSPGSERLAFASEINALLALPDVDRKPDRQAIYDFAALFFIPAPETFYVGIKALQPGEFLEAQFDKGKISWKTNAYHRWSIATEYSTTLDEASDQTHDLLSAAVTRQMESDVPLGALLSGGIDSSLVSAAAQSVLSEPLRTFNVRFPEKEYDETWAAVAVANHIGSRHEVLDIDGVPGTWEYISSLLCHSGQPFADTSLFAVNAVCRLMRQHLTVALSGDGGDEGFGGYNFYWQIARIARLQQLPDWALNAGALSLGPLARFDIVSASLPQRFSDLVHADNTSIVQQLFCWIREHEHAALCNDTDLLPVRRWFEPQWDQNFSSRTSRLERLSANATEANVRLMLANDFLFKVDIASMKESLEVRVPMLDEDLFTFGLSLPHVLKVDGRKCKRVLRKVAKRSLPSAVANKPKRGFGIPVDRWVDDEFKKNLKDALLGGSSKLAEFFKPESYRPIIEAFCGGLPRPGISREGLYGRAIMLLSVQLALCHK